MRKRSLGVIVVTLVALLTSAESATHPKSLSSQKLRLWTPATGRPRHAGSACSNDVSIETALRLPTRGALRIVLFPIDRLLAAIGTDYKLFVLFFRLAHHPNAGLEEAT